MVTTASSNSAPRARLEVDRAPELTLDALMARMRGAVQRNAPSLPTANGAGGSAGGESPQAAELLQLQVEFNQALVSAITAIAEHLRQLRAVDKPAAADQRANDVLPRVEALAAQVSDLAQRIDQAIAAFSTAVQSQGTLIQGLTSRLDVLDQTLAAAQQHAAARVSELEQRMASGQAAAEQEHQQLAVVSQGTKEQFAETELRLFRLERDMRRSMRSALAPTAPQLSSASAPQPQALSDFPFDYFLFEHRFRGPTEVIQQRQQAYLDYFASAESVLDLGCGRGEFVQLLTERGAAVVGVDLNQDMVDFCRSRGLPVVQGDLFEYLAAQPVGALGGIFVSQVVEHLPADQVGKLIQLAAGKLKIEGALLLETINPHCLPAMNWFYLDPTHVRPYPPALLSFMCEQAGFRMECVQFSGPVPGASGDRIWRAPPGVSPDEVGQYQDYAIIARRAQLD